MELKIYYDTHKDFFDKYMYPSWRPMNMGTWHSKHEDINFLNRILKQFDLVAKEIKSDNPFGSVIIGFKITGDTSKLTFFKMKFL